MTTDIFVRLVIDSGRRLTVIKESLSGNLDLPVTGLRKIAVFAFGSSISSPGCRSVLMKLKSQHTNKVVCMQAVEMTEICFDLLKTLANVNNKRIEIFGP